MIVNKYIKNDNKLTTVERPSSSKIKNDGNTEQRDINKETIANNPIVQQHIITKVK